MKVKIPLESSKDTRD
jgi:histone-binding protein RBBP4